MKLKQLEEKAKEKIEKEEEIKLIKFRNNINLQKIKGITKSIDFEKTYRNKRFNLDIKREATPEKIKKKLNRMKFERKKKDFNKKLTILCTIFIDEYDILLVSSSNNKISAWKYIENEFKNVNKIQSESKYNTDNTFPILDAELPQQTLEWDSVQKILFSGQSDGKILLWDINKSKHSHNSTLDFEDAKKNMKKI